MEQRTYVSGLRYLDADDVGDSPVDFGDMEVRASDGSTLGHLDGFIIDTTRARVLYTVVDSGGWFSSERFLVPIGHATLSSDRKALSLDLNRDRLENFPEFHEDRFRDFTDEDLRQFERRTISACCPDDSEGAATGYASERHYETPPWWTSAHARQERFRPIERRPSSTRTRNAVTGAAGRTSGTVDRELVRAHGDLREDERHREEARQRDDVSPHLGGRAQPGDVLGVETGGERSHLGETGEDEDERRRKAERAASKDDERR